uniref:hypothetical protein n=1 Tax=Xanthomonas albilineans TaxID=29447 RepID=UPI0027DC5B5A|nr:hypothetical protein [Xanthomonas albilineans]
MHHRHAHLFLSGALTMTVRSLLILALMLLTAACGRAAAISGSAAPAAVAAGMDTAIASTQSTAAATMAPVVMVLRTTVQSAVPLQAMTQFPSVSPVAAAHILRWEVISPAWYMQRLQHPVWPGGASGITWGIGYDGGYQTPAVIAADWIGHAHLAQLQRTGGVVGPAAAAALPAYRNITTPYALASAVFTGVSLPLWRQTASRIYGPAFDALPANAAGALVGNTYNRGGSMVGARNAEKRAIRDRCIPAGDLQCIAAQLRAQCRLWPDTPGLCPRRQDEARLVETAR